MTTAAHTVAIASLTAANAEMRQQNEELQETTSTLLARITALEGMMQPSPGASSAASSAASSSSSPDTQWAAALHHLTLRQTATPIPPFMGQPSGLECQRWLQSALLYFEETRMTSDSERLTVVGPKMQGPAQQWWQEERQKDTADTTKIKTWEQFTSALKQRYQPVDVAQWARVKLRELTTGSNTKVEEYNARFAELSSLITDNTESNRLFDYKDGLPTQVKQHLIQKGEDIKTLSAAMQMAVRFEAGRQASSSSASPSSFRWQHRGNNNQRPAAINQAEGEEQDPLQLIAAGLAELKAAFTSSRQQPASSSSGHRQQSGAQQAWHTPGLKYDLIMARRHRQLCVKCGKSGHWSKECKNAADLTTYPPTN